MSKPIVVETTRQVGTFPKGTELGYETEAKAKSVLGDAFKVVRYQTGAPIEVSTSQKAADAPKPAKKG